MTPKRWYCAGALASCHAPGCLGHTITPLIRQQAETAAWFEGTSWANCDQQTYVNVAGRFVTRKATA